MYLPDEEPCRKEALMSKGMEREDDDADGGGGCSSNSGGVLSKYRL